MFHSTYLPIAGRGKGSHAEHLLGNQGLDLPKAVAVVAVTELVVEIGTSGRGAYNVLIEMMFVEIRWRHTSFCSSALKGAAAPRVLDEARIAGALAQFLIIYL